jgi:hypothetical protein
MILSVFFELLFGVRLIFIKYTMQAARRSFLSYKVSDGRPANMVLAMRKAHRLRVIRMSVAPQILGSTSRGSEFFKIYQRCAHC